jgi:hypothetical protein
LELELELELLAQGLITPVPVLSAPLHALLDSELTEADLRLLSTLKVERETIKALEDIRYPRHAEEQRAGAGRRNKCIYFSNPNKVRLPHI